MNRAMKQFVREYENRGWAVEYTNHGHLKWVYTKNGGFTYTSSTPSDNRAFMNIKSQLKKIENGILHNTLR